MNELEFLRRQLAIEERNFAAVAAACSAALAPERDLPADREFLQSCAAYLLRAAGRACEREAAHAALLRADPDAGDAATVALRSALETNVASQRLALAHLERSPGAGASTGSSGTGSSPGPGGDGSPASDAALVDALRRFLAGVASLPVAGRHALDERIERRYGITEWRRTALVDADAILEERALHARVADCLPAGLSLAPADLPASPVRRATTPAQPGRAAGQPAAG